MDIEFYFIPILSILFFFFSVILIAQIEKWHK